MKFLRFFIYIFLILLPLIIFYNCASNLNLKIDPNEKFYLAHNIWIDNQYRSLLTWSRLGTGETRDIMSMAGQNTKISSINYKSGVLIGAGTELEHLKVFSDKVIFRIKRLSLAVTCDINKKLESTLSGKELFDRMITKKDFNALTSGISERYIEAIKSGVVIEGMPKEAVIIALGFPTSHSNSNLDSDSWVYWRTKYNTIEVQFDSAGLAIQNVIP